MIFCKQQISEMALKETSLINWVILLEEFSKPIGAETPRSLGQYHGCWYPGSLGRQDISSGRQDISSNGIDLARWMSYCHLQECISTTSIIPCWEIIENVNISTQHDKGLFPCLLCNCHPGLVGMQIDWKLILSHQEFHEPFLRSTQMACVDSDLNTYFSIYRDSNGKHFCVKWLCISNQTWGHLEIIN